MAGARISSQNSARGYLVQTNDDVGPRRIAHGKRYRRDRAGPAERLKPPWRCGPDLAPPLHLARRLEIAGSAPSQNLQARRAFSDPERSGENLPIPRLGAENPAPYLLAHELKGNALLKITGETIMQTITSALVALVLLTGMVGSAQALDARDFYEQVDRYHY